MAAWNAQNEEKHQTKNKGDSNAFYENMKKLVNNDKYRYVKFLAVFATFKCRNLRV